MRYISKDRLCDFEFHDSEWSFVSWEDGDLTVRISMLNIHKDTEQNDTGKDMEIKEAIMTFIGVKSFTYELPRTWHNDENGNSVTDDPLVVYEGGEAVERFINEIKANHYVTVMYFDEKDGAYEFGGVANGWISVTFAFDSVRVEWDGYSGKAWYWGTRHYKRKLVLNTENGEVTVEAFIGENTEPFCANGIEIAAPGVGIGFNYNNRHIFSGHFRTLEEALAGLHDALPEGVTVKGWEK